MTDQSYLEQVFGGLFGIETDEAGTWVTAEHRQHDQPAHTALLHRTFPTYTETMWVHAYPAARLITVTCMPVVMREGHEMPGVVRDIPLGWRDLGSPEKLRSKFERTVDIQVELGWTRKACEVR